MYVLSEQPWHPVFNRNHDQPPTVLKFRSLELWVSPGEPFSHVCIEIRMYKG